MKTEYTVPLVEVMLEVRTRTNETLAFVESDHEAPDWTLPPKFCPRCGSGLKLVESVAQWSAESLSPSDPGNVCELTEHQCDHCEGGSFWM